MYDGSPRKVRGRIRKKKSRELMIQNFPNLRKNTNLHIGEPQIGSMQRNSLISIFIMIDMLKPKKKILKQQVIIYEGSQ